MIFRNSILSLTLIMIVLSCKQDDKYSKGEISLSQELKSKAYELYNLHDQPDSLRKSLGYLSLAMEIDSLDHRILITSAQILVKIGKRDSAIQVIDKALGIKPNFVEAISFKGFVLERMKNSYEANKNYLKAIHIYDSLLQIEMNKSYLYNKVFISLFVNDKNHIISELDNMIINTPQDTFLLYLKNNIIKDFDRTVFLESY